MTQNPPMTTQSKVTVHKPTASPLTVGDGLALQSRINRNSIAYQAFKAEVDALSKLPLGMKPLSQSMIDDIFDRGNSIYQECLDTDAAIQKAKSDVLEVQMYKDIDELRAYQARQGHDDFWEDSSSSSDSDGYDDAEH